MVLLALSAMIGCRSPMARGSSSIEMLAPVETPQAKSSRSGEASQDIVINDISPSSKGELTKPVYPPQALAAHAGDCVVNVTITIDTDGLVSDVAPSWERLNIPNRFSDQFLEAIEAAVKTWRFEPARYVYWKKNGDADLTYIRAEIVQAKADIKFTFEATGNVR
jgi:hypothetical protein